MNALTSRYKIPNLLLEIQNKLLFKNHLKKFIVIRSFYSFGKFLEIAKRGEFEMTNTT